MDEEKLWSHISAIVFNNEVTIKLQIKKLLQSFCYNFYLFLTCPSFCGPVFIHVFETMIPNYMGLTAAGQ